MQVNALHSPVLCINAPEWYQESEFTEWLNNHDESLMTWHERDKAPSEWSDIIVFVDPSLNGEGSDSDSMPTVYWELIIKICRERFVPSTGLHIIVRITNLIEEQE